MSPHTLHQFDLSYDRYQELASELCEPIEPGLPTEVQLELYRSKLVYLNNLYQQCFRDINQSALSSSFTDKDLAEIRAAIDITGQFIRTAILTNLNESLDKLAINLRKKRHNPSNRVELTISREMIG